MPRRGVKGYDENIIQNMSDYNTSTGNYLAVFDYAPQLEKGLKDMREAIKQDESKAGVYADKPSPTRLKRGSTATMVRSRG